MSSLHDIISSGNYFMTLLNCRTAKIILKILIVNKIQFSLILSLFFLATLSGHQEFLHLSRRTTTEEDL